MSLQTEIRIQSRSCPAEDVTYVCERLDNAFGVTFRHAYEPLYRTLVLSLTVDRLHDSVQTIEQLQNVLPLDALDLLPMVPGLLRALKQNLHFDSHVTFDVIEMHGDTEKALSMSGTVIGAAKPPPESRPPVRIVPATNLF